MKKKLLALLLVAGTATVCAFGFAGCNGVNDNEKHQHNFTKQVIEEKYLKHIATSSQKAEYYLSCECGEKGTATFEHGNMLQATVGLDYELSEDGKYYSVSGIGTATEADIVIAAEIEGIPVIEIGRYAFDSCTNLTEINIPDGIIRIEREAFLGCTALTKIIIPDSVTSIGEQAFNGCEKFTSIFIPYSVTSIGNAAFGHGLSLESIEVDTNNAVYKSENNCLLSKDGKTLIAGCNNSIIPDSVTSIGTTAFYGYSSLKSITIPYGVTEIGEAAFIGCNSLTSLTIPDSVIIINGAAFDDCSGLTSITIPNSVTIMGPNVFSWCMELSSIVYKGTKEQWSNIKKDWYEEAETNWWGFGSSVPCTIFCIDGKLDTLGNEIE